MKHASSGQALQNMFSNSRSASDLDINSSIPIAYWPCGPLRFPLFLPSLEGCHNTLVVPKALIFQEKIQTECRANLNTGKNNLKVLLVKLIAFQLYFIKGDSETADKIDNSYHFWIISEIP